MFKFETSLTISPSITHSLCESVSFLLAHERDERIRVYSEIKELYHKRSKIVHGGSNTISQTDFSKAIYYSRQVIIQLLTDSRFTNFKNNNDIRNYLRNEVFG